jgi:hypothetical protein
MNKRLEYTTYKNKAKIVSDDIAYFISKKQFDKARLLLDAFEVHVEELINGEADTSH